MFDKLKKAFTNATKSIAQKELSEKDLDNNLFDLQLALLESDIAQEVIDEFSQKLKGELLGLKLEKRQTTEDVIRSKFHNALEEMFIKAGKIDLIEKIKSNREENRRERPFVIVFLGINGTGKTTTVAKIAHLLRKKGFSVVLAAADTHRAGAIEQLTRHAERLSLKVIAQNYGADPSAVCRDAVEYAKKHYIDTVLIDTAGRMQTAKNLMDEISKIIRVVKPDMKLFVGDSLAGNDTINQSTEFFKYTNFDGAILTKIDADAKGGAAISIVHMTSKPIVYLGVGQNYEDIIPFDFNKFLESIFGDAKIIHEDLTETKKVSGLLREPIPSNATYSVKEQQKRPLSSLGVLDNASKMTEGGEEEEAARVQTSISTSKLISNPSEQPPSTLISKENQKKGPLGDEEEKKFEANSSSEKSSAESISSQLGSPANDKYHNLQAAKVEKKKKGYFNSLFSRKDKEKKAKIQGEDDDDGKKVGVTEEAIKSEKDHEEKMKNEKDSKKYKENAEEIQKRRVKDNNIIYLSDEDVEDLLK
jgi:fused signal recognition particle receptor